MSIRLRWVCSVALASVLVSQVPARAIGADSATEVTPGGSEQSSRVCAARPLADPPLWERSLPLATESSALSASDPGCVKEVGRTAAGIVWQNPDRSLTSQVYAAPVNYQAADGSWQAIDTRLVDDGNGRTVNKAGPFGVSIAATADAASLVRLSDHGAAVSFGFDGVANNGDGVTGPSVASRAVVGGDAQDTVTFTDALAGIDLRYRLLNSELKEELVLKQPLPAGVVPQFKFSVQLNGLTARSADDGTIQFVDPSGVAVFSVPQGLAFDASGDLASNTAPASAPVSVQLVPNADPAVATLLVSVDPKWLSDPARVFPVTIDPSINASNGGLVSGDAYVSSAHTTTTYNGAAQYDGLWGHYEDLAGKLSTTTWYSFVQLPDLSFLNGQDILSAHFNAYAFYDNGASATLKVQPANASWDPTTITYGTMPGVRSNNASYTYASAPAWGAVDISSFIGNWASGTWGQYGLRLYGSSGYLELVAQDYAPDHVPYVDVTYDAYPTLSNFTAGGRYLAGTVNDSTPSLSAQINDTDSNVGLVGTFQVWNSSHTTMLQSHAGSTVSNGQNTTWTPATLSDGSYTWRVQGSDGTASSAWSDWQTLKVDTAAPSAPTCSWSGGTHNGWHAQGTTNSLSLSESPTSDAQQFLWGLDVADNPTNTADASSGAASVDITNVLTDGWHDLACRTIDPAGNVSAVTHWTFGVGDGGFAAPQMNLTTQMNVPVQVSSKTTYNGIVLKWRRADTDATWTTVSLANVTYQAGGGVAAWPVTATPGANNTTFPALVWNVPQSTTIDGPIQLDVEFYSSGTDSGHDVGAANSRPAVTLDQSGTGWASAAAGPGNVNLLTGNLELSAADVSLAGGSVFRTFDSRDQNAGDVFGPGWKSNVTAASPYTSLLDNGDTVEVYSGQSADPIGFSQITTGSSPTYRAQDGSTDLTLQKTSSTAFTLGAPGGNTYEFDYKSGTVPSNKFVPAHVTNAFTGETSQISWSVSSGVVSPSLVVGPTPPGIFTSPYTCDNPPTGYTPGNTPGCQSLTFDYGSSTGATSTCGGTDGDVTGQVQSVSYIAWDPAISAMNTVQVAAYCYDTTSHRLDAEWDPRISPALKTIYSYDSYGHVYSVAPPDAVNWYNDWYFGYTPMTGEAASTGRLSAVSRFVPTYSGNQAVTTSYVYGIPLTTGAGGAYNLDATSTAGWGQHDNPTNATAVFPPDQTPSGSPPSSYTRARVYYLDAEGSLVNVAQPGGEISTTEYDSVGAEVRSLSPGNRAAALLTGTTATEHAAASRLWDTQTVYDAADINVTDTYGPAHEVDLPDLTSRTARQHEHSIYDENVPSALAAQAPFNLVTTQTESAAPIDGTAEQDARTTSYKYDLSGDNTGWQLGTPLQTIVDPGTTPHLNLATTTNYDLGTGQMTARILPAHPAGGDTHETDFVVYTAGTNPVDSLCGGAAGWAGLPCRQGPAAQPGTSGMPNIATTYTTKYNMYGQPEETKDKDGTTVLRTSDVTYDGAGRPTSQSVTSSAGTAIDTVTNSYSTTTGLPYQTIDSAASLTITRSYDDVGQLSSYQDADGNTTTYTYDQLGNTHSVNDGKGTTSYTYDTSTDARGPLTSISDSQVSGSWTATYDADGNISTESYPGGNVSASMMHDTVGEPTARVYYTTGCFYCTGPNDWPTFVASYNIHGQRTTDQGTLEASVYQYDNAGRLTTTDDAQIFGCTRRTYGFDADTNRTSLNVKTGNILSGACPPSGTGTTTNHTYDAADRITDTGNTYDALGRTTALPTTSSPSGHATTLSYYTNDLVRSTATNGTTMTYGLDPDRRAHNWTDGTNTHTNHYPNDSDSPAWTAENSGGTNWTRNISAFDGLAATVNQATTATLQLANLHGDIFSTVTPGTTDWLADLGTTASWTATDEYGNPGTTTPTVGNRYDYLGTARRQRDTNSGLQLMGQRVYNSTTGRFLQTDPVLGGSANAYDYVGGDPVNGRDLTGRLQLCTMVPIQHSGTRQPCPGRVGWTHWSEQLCTDTCYVSFDVYHVFQVQLLYKPEGCQSVSATLLGSFDSCRPAVGTYTFQTLANFHFSDRLKIDVTGDCFILTCWNDQIDLFSRTFVDSQLCPNGYACTFTRTGPAPGHHQWQN